MIITDVLATQGQLVARFVASVTNPVATLSVGKLLASWHFTLSLQFVVCVASNKAALIVALAWPNPSSCCNFNWLSLAWVSLALHGQDYCNLLIRHWLAHCNLLIRLWIAHLVVLICFVLWRVLVHFHIRVLLFTIHTFVNEIVL